MIPEIGVEIFNSCSIFLGAGMVFGEAQKV